MQHESQISLSTLNSRLQYQILQFIINATKSFRMLCIDWRQRAGKEVTFLLLSCLVRYNAVKVLVKFVEEQAMQ